MSPSFKSWNTGCSKKRYHILNANNFFCIKDTVTAPTFSESRSSKVLFARIVLPFGFILSFTRASWRFARFRARNHSGSASLWSWQHHSCDYFQYSASGNPYGVLLKQTKGNENCIGRLWRHSGPKFKNYVKQMRFCVVNQRFNENQHLSATFASKPSVIHARRDFKGSFWELPTVITLLGFWKTPCGFHEAEHYK